MGTDIRKANRAADGRSNPRNMPPEIVVPLRDAPGKIANTCKNPIKRASSHVIELRVRSFFVNHSARNSKRAAVNNRMAASLSGFLNKASTASFKIKPKIKAGIVAMMIYQASLFCAVENGLAKNA